MDHEYTVVIDDEGTRLDTYLALSSGLSRSRIKKIIDSGMVKCGDASDLKPSYPVEIGDVISFNVPEAKTPDFLPENIPIDVVYRDEHLIVVNKPTGMVVHPGRGNFTGTLASALLYHCDNLSSIGGAFRPGIVHRLDKDTAGLIIAALNDDVHTKLAEMIQNREIEREYIAYIWGHPNEKTGTINAPIGRNPKKPTQQAVVELGKPSISHYTLLERYDFLSKMKIALQTGRTHQIRVHMAHIGHHVFGDPMYGGRDERLKGFTPEIRSVARFLLKRLPHQALYSAFLSFKHPVTGEQLDFEASPPKGLMELDTYLNKDAFQG